MISRCIQTVYTATLTMPAEMQPVPLSRIGSALPLSLLCWYHVDGSLIQLLRSWCCCLPQGLTAGRPGAPSGSSCPSPGQTAAQGKTGRQHRGDGSAWVCVVLGSQLRKADSIMPFSWSNSCTGQDRQEPHRRECGSAWAWVFASQSEDQQ